MLPGGLLVSCLPLPLGLILLLRSGGPRVGVRPSIDTACHGQTRLNALGLRFELINIPIGGD